MSARVLMAVPLAGLLAHGGHVWAMLNWILAFESCGFGTDVVDPSVAVLGPTSVASIAGARDLLRRNGFVGSYTAVSNEVSWTIGDLNRDEIRHVTRRVDALVNVSGAWRDPMVAESRRPVYLDLDPGFTQIWADQGVDMGLDGHASFVTVGLDIGRPECEVPTVGRRWVTTLPPVDARRWELPPAPPGAPYTTVANWRSYGPVEHAGRRYGQKAHTIRRFAELPTSTCIPIELALSIDPTEDADLAALDAAGWTRVDAALATSTADDYRSYIRSSRGELGLAKEGYVVGRTGWVSDRSACYLAAGRPVIALDTGGADELPDTEGFVRFHDVATAVERLEEVERGWSAHSNGARDLVERRFAPAVVVPHLLEAA